MKPDGTDIRQLTSTSNATEIAPSLSPLGDKIAYIQVVTNETTEEEIYSLWMMDSSGQNRILLVDNIVINIFPQPAPVWSPDGKYIAYNAQVQNQSNTTAYQIFLYNLDSGEIIQITDNILGGIYPSWMPDSQKLVYRDRFGIHAINIFTREITNIFDEPAAVETHLAVSPDGSKIAFTYFTDTTETGNRDIYTLDLAADLTPSNLQQITSHTGLDWMPRWHPDGNSIYFESHRDTGNPSIWMVNVDASGVRQISPANEANNSPFIGLMRTYLPRKP
jgi:Tol biopolymer transport system component